MRRIFSALCVLASLVLASPVSAQTLYRACTGTLPDVPIPPDALHKVEVIQPEYQPPQKMTNLGFTHGVAVMNVVTSYPCGRNIGSMVEIQWLKIFSYSPATAVRTLEQTVTASGASTFTGETWYREPAWFQSGKPSAQPYLTWNSAGNFAVSVQSTPLGIYHAWSQPRLAMKPGLAYFIEVRLRVVGDTRIQFGFDYWRGAMITYNGYSLGCVNSNNCEAYQTHWIGPTNGQFVTVATPTMLYLP